MNESADRCEMGLSLRIGNLGAQAFGEAVFSQARHFDDDFVAGALTWIIEQGAAKWGKSLAAEEFPEARTGQENQQVGGKSVIESDPGGVVSQIIFARP